MLRGAAGRPATRRPAVPRRRRTVTTERVNRAAEHPALARLSRGVTLAEGARSGGAWMASASLGTQVFQFLVSIVMARLLFPSEFGEAALVYSITGFAAIFTDLGLGAAVVHAKHVTEDLLSSAFWLNTLTGAGLTLLISALAVPVSLIYGQPGLIGLMVLVSLNFTLSCGGVHLALLERTFHFRRIAAIETGSAVISTAATPVFALLGLGVYSLVLGPLLGTCLLSASLLASVPWWPRRWASRAAIRELWHFSRGLVGFNSVNYWARNLDNVLLGGTVSSAQLGEYNRAYSLMMIPVSQIGAVLIRVLYPALARMQDEPKRLGRAWSRAVTAATSSITLPLAVTMAATAPALVRVLYGPRWTGMVTVLELLSLAAVPQILGASTGGAYRAAGRTGLLFRLGVVVTACTAVAIVIGLPWGTTGVAVAILVNSWLCLPIVVAPLARILELPLSQLLRPAIAGWVSCAAIAAAELLVRVAVPPETPAWQVLILQLCAGGVVYLAVMWRSRSEVAVAAKDRVRRLVTMRQRPSAGGAR
jgi:O-antigen/teichoic acid export membrane protein